MSLRQTDLTLYLVLDPDLCGGADGMVAGQVLDLTDYGRDRETLNDLCARKTGCLLRCAARPAANSITRSGTPRTSRKKR